MYEGYLYVIKEREGEREGWRKWGKMGINMYSDNIINKII